MRSLDRELDEKAFIGICYPSKRLFRNHRRRFMPASTTKLYTSWLACEVLGEDYVFHSEYAVEGTTLYLRPMGNPLLSEDALRPMVEDTQGRGIEEVVLSRTFVGAPHVPPAWMIGDTREAWGAPISEVCFHENFGVLEGSKDVRLTPSGAYYSMRRTEGVPQPSVRGRVISLPAGFKGRYEFPLLDPEDFLVHWIAERIGAPAVRKRIGRLRGTPVPFEWAPLRDVLRKMNKTSSNILAELLLEHAALALGKSLEYEQPQAAYAAVLRPIGVEARLYDGSGVSRYNLVSPAGTVALLEAATKYRSLVDSLPIGGKDGTLADRRLPRRIRAKTGSLTGVQALAGYDAGEPFSIVVNHGPTDDRPMIEAIDAIVRGR